MKLRATAWGADMVIVALTGWGQETDMRASTEAGFDAHLTKPIDPEQLQRELQLVASRRAAGD